MNPVISTLSRGVLLAAAALTICARANGEAALCLKATGPELLMVPPTVQIHFVIKDESSKAGRRLIARATIVRVTRRVAGLRLLTSLSSLETASIDQFIAFCGDTVTSEMDLGQMIEATWALDDSLGLPLTVNHFDQSFDLNSAATASHFARFVDSLASELKHHAGHIRSSSLSATPGSLVEKPADTAVAAFAKLLSPESDAARGVIDSREVTLTGTDIRALQKGNEFRPGEL